MRVRGYVPETPCWAVLSTGDVAAAGAFYQGLLGWTVEDGVFRSRGLAVAGLVAASGPAGWVTHVATDDVGATAGLVVDAGGTVLVGPSDVGTRGRSALFADPTGAVFGVWQRGTFAGAQVVDEPGAVCWSETVTRDLPATTAFYGKVFDWSERPGSVATLQEYREWVCANRVVGGLSLMDGDHPAHWRTILLVEDCAATVTRATELGGSVVAGPLDAGVGQAAFIVDPTGGAFLVIDLIEELRAGMS